MTASEQGCVTGDPCAEHSLDALKSAANIGDFIFEIAFGNYPPAMSKVLIYFGLQRTDDSVELFRTRHSYVALAIAVAVIIVLGKIVF